MATMNISLPDQMKDWVEAQSKSGKYGNASDYVRDLIRHDQEREAARAKMQRIVDEARASGFSKMGRDELIEFVTERAKAAVAKKKLA